MHNTPADKQPAPVPKKTQPIKTRTSNMAPKLTPQSKDVTEKVEKVPTSSIPEPKKPGAGLIILIILLGLMVVISAGAAFWFCGGKNLFQKNEQKQLTESTPVVEATIAETEYEPESESTNEAYSDAETKTESETKSQPIDESKEYFVGRKRTDDEIGQETQPTVSEPESEMGDPSEDEMMFFDSDRRYLNRAELGNLSAAELRIARNEIYARHGRLFTDPELQAYFDRCDWYHGTIPGNQFSESMLNEYEVYNRDLISSMENK